MTGNGQRSVQRAALQSVRPDPHPIKAEGVEGAGSAARTGVLGGTFDPPHLGHLTIAAAAREQLRLDRVLFVPAGMPWRKADRNVTDATLRVRMVEAAIADLPWAEVSTVEVDRGGPSFAAETMRLFAADGGDWWFILGDDALLDLPNWHEPEALIATVRLAVAPRDSGDEESGIPPDVISRLHAIETRIDWLRMSELAISSSDLRGRIREELPTDVLLPARVRAVIDEAGLYRG
jgi:nicotinate-nucleotide adenylyltransferase